MRDVLKGTWKPRGMSFPGARSVVQRNTPTHEESCACATMCEVNSCDRRFYFVGEIVANKIFHANNN